MRPDILVLTDIDYDHGGAALTALADLLRGAGLDYPHAYQTRPNTGVPTGIDIDGDGRRNRARDAQGWGYYNGHGGSAVLSARPILAGEAQDLSHLLWRDLPGSLIEQDDPAHAVQRLSSDVHWLLPVEAAPGLRVSLMVFHATPPVFDGPKDRNGRRNADEIRLWQVLLDGRLGVPPPDSFVIAGNANLDPEAGDGRREAIRALLADPRLRDPLPGVPSVDWSRLDLGQMRVSYLLPSRDLAVRDAGVHEAAAEAGEHRLVWVDLEVTEGR
ncbi:Endonuclease/Exonuclease/phosphatase family protein [Roseivivax sediminis]|uniref:Endonuclease/Exonuclease/phosphatase family protein n=1 Tax=Roseivivax sediminis TaxID=936889 RepID=A0A1I1U511_9RHOB|nr:Endonuclease/Exonuclease/phosphatase family protein [Roseivivax sediminis]